MRPSEIKVWSFSSALRQKAREQAAVKWLSDTDCRCMTYGDLDGRVSAIAAGLQARGVAAGQRVLLLASNSLDFVAVLIGIMRSGAVVVPVNTALSGRMLAHVCRDADASALIADSEGLEKFREIAGELPQLETVVVIGGGQAEGDPSPLSLAALERDGLGRPLDEPADHEAGISAILYTSGTTGPAKGVLLPQAHLFQNAWLYIEQMRMTPEDSVYCALPMFHLNGLTLQLFASLIVGCPLTIRAHFSASAWIDDVRRCGATLTNLLGSMTEFVFAQPQRPDDAENKLRHIVAVPTLAAIREQFEARFDLRLVELYGMTEITCPIYMPLDGGPRPGSCGRLLTDWFEARIVDPDTDMEVPAGAVGELVLRPRRANGFMAGYFRRSEEAVKAWRNLWFHTGDAVRRDGEGFFYFADRLKDCVRRRGENISTFEVEQAVLGCELVEEVAVVGTASPFRDGEQEVKACIVARPGTDPQAIFDYCRGALPTFALPRIIELVDTLPKTATGKVEKHLLRAAGVTASCWLAPDINAPRKRA